MEHTHKRQSGLERASTTPPPSASPMPSLSAFVTVQNPVPPRSPSCMTGEVSGVANSEVSTKRNGVGKGSAVGDTGRENGDNGHLAWPPFDFSGGVSPVYFGKLISFQPESGGSWWCCKIQGCLTRIPDAHIAAGRVNIQKHIDGHYLAIRTGSSTVEEEPMGVERDVRPLVDKIERLAKFWDDDRKERERNFEKRSSELIEIDRKRRIFDVGMAGAKNAKRHKRLDKRGSEMEYNDVKANGGASTSGVGKRRGDRLGWKGDPL